MSDKILNPGEYFIELEFLRPVRSDVLHRALAGMGFETVIFDQSADASTGALKMARPTKKETPAPTPAPAPAAPGQGVDLRASAFAPPPKPAIMLRSVAKSSAPNTVPPPSGGGGAAAKSGFGDEKKPAAVAAAAAAAAIANPKTPSPITTLPGAGLGLPVPAAVPAPVPAPGAATDSGVPVPAPAPAPAPAAPTPVADGGGGGGGGGGGEAPPSFAPAEEAPPAYEKAAAPATLDPIEMVKAALVELWTKWKEWGSPFAEGPTTSGEGNASYARFVGILTRPIILNDLPGVRWLFVKRLKFSTLGDLSNKANPFPLRHGAYYEFRFLARSKANPTRDEVKKGLADMGFAPMKLMAIKRNMRLPGRGGASLALWYGVGKWLKGDSVVVSDDPFCFENLEEVRV